MCTREHVSAIFDQDSSYRFMEFRLNFVRHWKYSATNENAIRITSVLFFFFIVSILFRRSTAPACYRTLIRLHGAVDLKALEIVESKWWPNYKIKFRCVHFDSHVDIENAKIQTYNARCMYTFVIFIMSQSCELLNGIE